MGKQELGGIRVHLEVRTSGSDLGLEQSVVVLRAVRRWPAFDPLFLLGGRGPIQRSGQLCCLNSSQHCSDIQGVITLLDSIDIKHASAAGIIPAIRTLGQMYYSSFGVRLF